jgi:hypothetical protein
LPVRACSRIFARASHIDHHRTIRGDRGSLPADVASPAVPAPASCDSGGVGNEGVPGVVAEQFQISADEGVDRSGGGDETVVKVEQRYVAGGEREPSPALGVRDPGNQRVRPEPGPDVIEVLRKRADPLAQPLRQRVPGVDLPIRADRGEPEGIAGAHQPVSGRDRREFTGTTRPAV